MIGAIWRDIKAESSSSEGHISLTGGSSTVYAVVATELRVSVVLQASFEAIDSCPLPPHHRENTEVGLQRERA